MVGQAHLAVRALPLDLLHEAQRVVRKAVRLEHLVRLIKHHKPHAAEAQQALGHPALQLAVRADDDLLRVSAGGSREGEQAGG